MIHSMCGGGLKNNEIYSFAKVRFENEQLCGLCPYWFISDIAGLKAGERVLAPFGKNDEPLSAVVLRVDDSDEQTPPFPIKTMKYLVGKL